MDGRVVLVLDPDESKVSKIGSNPTASSVDVPLKPSTTRPSSKTSEMMGNATNLAHASGMHCTTLAAVLPLFAIR